MTERRQERAFLVALLHIVLWAAWLWGSSKFQMIELIGLGREQGYDRLKEVVNLAMSLGCWDVAAVRHLLLQER